MLQQASPLEVHAPPLPTHDWHVPSRHALEGLQQSRPLEVHAALFSTQGCCGGGDEGGGAGGGAGGAGGAGGGEGHSGAHANHQRSVAGPA